MIANGSYARSEASPESDLDYFILHDPKLQGSKLQDIQTKVRAVVKQVIGKAPSEGGAFDAVVPLGMLAKRIGGSEDTNENITRRILFLTEGMPLNNQVLYETQRDELINRYVKDEVSDHQLGMFLLNDLIRYYRTVCVDFEFKTFEANKDWGVRNIKLVFSRKLLYISGVLISAEMAQRTPAQKREIARSLIALTPVQRLRTVCGSYADRAVKEYSNFLTAMGQKNIREILSKVTADRRTHTEEFKRLKNQSHHFTLHLMSALKATYAESHPIHRSLVM